jgi:hypothetical protein
MMTLSPSEARRQFFHLGELAEQGPVLVLASTPFLVTPVGGPLPSREAPPAGSHRHVDLELLGSLDLTDLEFPPIAPRLEDPGL